MQLQKEYRIQVLDDLGRILPEIESFLKHNDLKNAITFVNFAITELALNAVKAIQKRIYFRERNYDLERDYKKGITEFSNNLKFSEVNIDEILQNNSDYSVNLEISQKDNLIYFRVYNNIEILPQEMDSINQLLHIAQKNNSLLDVPENINPEGAGMGLKMIILMARNMGLDEKILNFKSANGTTEFIISLPKSLCPEDKKAEDVCKIIARKLTKLPVLEEEIPDPGKIINYMINHPGVLPDFSAKFSSEKSPVAGNETSEIYLKSINVTNYTAYLNKSLKLKLSEHLCKTTSMVHDLGKIIFSLLDEDTLDEIRVVTKRKKPVNENIPIEIILGISDITLGVIMARHWKFQENIINAIKFQYTPWKAGPEEEKLTYLLHLGLAFSNLEEKNDINQFFPETLEKLKTGYNNLKNFYDSIDKKMVKQY